MGPATGSPLNRLMSLMRSPWPAAVLVTVVALGTVGTILVVTTPAGCRLAQNAGLHLTGANCQNPRAAVFTPTPSPTASAAPTPGGTAIPTQGAFPSPLPIPTANPNVPHDPSLPPYQFDAGRSAAYPPTYPAASDLASSFGSTDSTTFSCRLPIYAGGPGSGGFLVLPDRTFIADPRSGVTVPSPSPGSSPPPAQYGPQGWFGLTYDVAAGRWVPVPRSWVAPDGKRYAYPGNPDGIYVVDVAANTQTEIGEGRRWSVLDVEAEGVYATEQNLAGLWLLPFAGSPTQLTTLGYWTAIGGGAAYGTETSSVPNGVATVIDRFDLKTHARQHWFAVANAQTSVFGFDAAGHPIMMVRGVAPGVNSNQLWLVKGLGAVEVLTDNNNFSGPPIGDSHGIWLMNYQATYLFVPGQGPYLVANVGGQLGGGCV